jgi:hypothetical protein
MMAHREDETLDDALDVLMDAIGEPEKIAEGLAELEGVEPIGEATNK